MPGHSQPQHRSFCLRCLIKPTSEAAETIYDWQVDASAKATWKEHWLMKARQVRHRLSFYYKAQMMGQVEVPQWSRTREYTSTTTANKKVPNETEIR